jgi:hypothetical protein
MPTSACLFASSLALTAEAPPPRPSCVTSVEPPGAEGEQGHRGYSLAPEAPWDPDDDLDSLIDAINANFMAEVRASLVHARPPRPAQPGASG